MGLLEVQHLTKHFGGLTAVRDLSFAIPEGTISALIGANGAGKTTVFNMICRFLQPTSGDIRYRYDSLLPRKPYELAYLGLARTFQIPQIWGEMTPLETVMVGAHPRLVSSLLEVGLGLRGAQREEEQATQTARRWLDYVGLDEVGQRAGNLPLGKIRRLELARALAADPQVLLLDEPASGLTPAETEWLAGLLFKIRDELDKTILLIEHNMRLVMGIADFIVVLDQGEKIAEGTAEQVRSDRRVQEAYFGRRLAHA